MDNNNDKNIKIKHRLKETNTLLSCKHDDIILTLVKDLKKKPTVKLINALHQHLLSADKKIQKATFDTLQNWPFDEAVETLMSCIKDKNTAIRNQAISTLGFHPNFNKWAILIPFLNASDETTQQVAIIALSNKAPHQKFLAFQVVEHSLRCYRKFQEVQRQHIQTVVFQPC